MDDQFSAQLALARAGDVTMLGLLLERYRPRLQLLARAQLGHRLQGKVDEADVVQEVCLDAHRHLPHFRGTTEAQFAGWLRQILLGKIVDQTRRYIHNRGRDARRERDVAEALRQGSRVADGCLRMRQKSPSQMAALREDEGRLACALAQLPEKYRRAVMLRNLEGLTFGEVARRMGRTQASVEKLWLRGLEQLKRLLKSAA